MLNNKYKYNEKFENIDFSLIIEYLNIFKY